MDILGDLVELWKLADRAAFLFLVTFLAFALYKEWLVTGSHYRELKADRDRAREKLDRLLEIANAGAMLAERIWHEREPRE